MVIAVQHLRSAPVTCGLGMVNRRRCGKPTALRKGGGTARDDRAQLLRGGRTRFVTLPADQVGWGPRWSATEQPKRPGRAGQCRPGKLVSQARRDRGSPARAVRRSWEAFEGVVIWLGRRQGATMTHAEWGPPLARHARVVRQLYQDHLDLRSEHEERLEVVNAEGSRTAPSRPAIASPGHRVRRGNGAPPGLPSPRRGEPLPADAALALPEEITPTACAALPPGVVPGSFDETVGQ